MLNNSSGTGNTAIGESALHSNTVGSENTAIGRSALLSNTVGSDIVAVGANAGQKITSADHVCIAHLVRTSATAVISGISSATIDPAGALVGIDASGKLGTTASSRRFKCDIKPMEKAGDAILALKPVAFHYKSDAKNTPCYGLIAEEVEKVDRDLVVRDKEGKPYSVRYDQINAMLLNEFLEEHNKVEKLESTVENLVATMKEQAAQSKSERRAGIHQTHTASRIEQSVELPKSSERSAISVLTVCLTRCRMAPNSHPEACACGIERFYNLSIIAPVLLASLC